MQIELAASGDEKLKTQSIGALDSRLRGNERNVLYAWPDLSPLTPAEAGVQGHMLQASMCCSGFPLARE